MIASLDNLKNNCKNLRQKFDGLLVVPGMEFLLVDNPFLIEDQQALLKAEIADTTPSKVAKLNVREMIIRFKTVRVPRKLCFFSRMLSFHPSSQTDGIYAAVRNARKRIKGTDAGVAHLLGYPTGVTPDLNDGGRVR